MNRSIDELTASELNAAIDDTNFPRARSLSIASVGDDTNALQNGKTNHTTNPLNGNDENSNGHPTATDEPNSPNDQNDSNATNDTNDTNDTNSIEPIPSPVQNGIKGFIKRAHPAPLKMVAFKADSIDVPGTPRTPRTSTTPGIKSFESLKLEHILSI